MSLRAFLFLLAVDVAVVAAGLALFGHDAPHTPRGEAGGDRDVARVEGEIKVLRAEALRIQERLDAFGPPGAREPSAPPPSRVKGAGPQFPEGELERLEAALKAVEKRRAFARAREGLRMGVKHVFPELSEDQQAQVAEAIIGYRTTLSRALQPGGVGADEGYALAKEELLAGLTGVVPPEKAAQIVKHYAVRPGPPKRPPSVSPPTKGR